MYTVLLLLALGSNPADTASPPWHNGLSLGNDGYWRQRVHLVLHNRADQPQAGVPLDVALGRGEGQADLAGARADDLRVVNAAGAEMLWALRGPDGLPIARGPLPPGSVLTIPVECAAQSRADYFVYFGNPAAWPVPDFLDAAVGLRNGGLEEGHGDAPTGWTHDPPDPQHQALWSDEHPHSGKKCLKTVVAPGAEATWISTRQSAIHIRGGARYALRGWVKAAGVVGQAGWYLHVGNAQNSMLLAPMLNAGGGTYDWKRVQAEFTAPAQATLASVGTMLRGTGTAWFDDVELVCLDASRPVVTVQASPAEHLELQEIGAAAPWPNAEELSGFDTRVPIRVLNTSAAAQTAGLVRVDLSPALARLHGQVGPEDVQVWEAGKRIAAYCVDGVLLLEGSLPPHSARTWWAYLRRGRPIADAEPTERTYAANPALPGGQTRETLPSAASDDYRRLLASPGNLLRNADFERGERLPEDWSGASEGLHVPGVKMGLVAGGRFGKRCAELTVPASAKQHWIGWRQEVAVEPGTWYFLAAWLKCRDLVGTAGVHVHLRDAHGQLCREGGMTGIGPGVNGTADWSMLQGVFPMPSDAARLQLHLTIQAQGTVWHDGVVLCAVHPGRLGALEQRSASPMTGPAAWPVNAVVKVFHDDLPPSTPVAARITAARNEREPLQLAVRSSRPVAGVRVVVDPPRAADGRRLSDCAVGIVGYVPVDHPTNYYRAESPAWQRKSPTGPGRSDGWAGWWPDPLLPRDTFDLPAQSTQSVWVTVHVPQEAAAGDYHGAVRFVAGGATVAETPITVHVWDFVLPDAMHVKAIFDCRQSGPMWAVPGATPEQVRREFWKFMAQRRTCPDRVEPAPQLRYEHGHVVADFTAFDAAADYYFNTLHLPHSYTPAQFYAFGWGFPPKNCFGEAPYEGQFPYENVDRSVLRPQFKQAYQACLRAFWDHIQAKGWRAKFTLYISDEPFDALEPVRRQMQALCAMIHEVDPTIPIYSSTWHHQPAWDGYLSVWGFGHFGIVPAEKLAQIRRDGATLWWTTDGQMCIDTPCCATERLLPHFCFKYRAEAYEFWGVDWLTYDPYQYGWHRYIPQSDKPGVNYYVRYPSGDGYLAYPGAPLGHAGAVSSIRLEQAREGCEDYEYLYLLRARIARAQAAGHDVTAAERVLAKAQDLVSIPNAGGLQSTRVLPDPDAVLRVKESVAREIERLREYAAKE